MSSYFAACRGVTDGLNGQPFVVDGEPWSNRDTFRYRLNLGVVQRLNTMALQRGLNLAHGDLYAPPVPEDFAHLLVFQYHPEAVEDGA